MAKPRVATFNFENLLARRKFKEDLVFATGSGYGGIVEAAKFQEVEKDDGTKASDHWPVVMNIEVG